MQNICFPDESRRHYSVRHSIMRKDSSSTERSQAEALKAKLLYQDVCLAAQRLDFFLRKGNAHKEVFKPHVLALRDMVQQVCIKLMFLYPVDYGRKAEELLWRKTYSDVAMLLMKTNKKYMETFTLWEAPLRAHLKGGLRFYEHLFLFLQNHYELKLQSYIDWPHKAIHLIGCKRVGPTSEEEKAWARMACHRCLLYLGDLFRYQNEFLALATKDLAERCYYRALSVAPYMGMPFNQLGALVGNTYYDVEATYFYQRCLHSEVPFKGASWNLKRLYDHAGKRYSHLKRYQGRKLSPSQRQCWDNKRLLVSFLYLQSLLQPQRKFRATRLMALCQLVLEDFGLCLSYRPYPSDLNQPPTGRKPSRGYLFLPDLLIFHMVVLCLMSVHSLKKTGSKQYRAAVIFTLTLFSHLIQHVNTRIQSELQKGELTSAVTLPHDRRQEQEPEESQQEFSVPSPGHPWSTCQRSHRSSSVTSEGDNSEASVHSCCDSDEMAKEESTSFSSPIHSETSSETSYSDTTDEEDRGISSPEAMHPTGVKSTCRVAQPKGKLHKCKSPTSLLDFLKTTISANLPAPLSQKLQGKCGLHLTPVLSCSLLRTRSELNPVSNNSPDTEDNMSSLPKTAPPTVFTLGQNISMNQTCHNRQIIQRKLQVLSAEGLFPTIKVIMSWLRTNHSLLTSCWQGPLSLWEHLSVLLNLLPSEAELQETELGLSHYLHNLLQSCLGPNIPRFPQLPEDTVLCQNSPLESSLEKEPLDQELPQLSMQEAAAVRICFLRSFGHFATTLPGQLLRFDAKLGVFVSTALEGSENPSQPFLERTSRIRFSKDIVQLWLQREVVHLEKTLRGLQIRSALTPYLFPDPRALCEHISVIQQLSTSGKFFLIIPKIVVDILYVLRKEDHRALAAITFLEDELKRGNQYILCQSFVSKKFVRPRMTRPDSDAWDLYNILDFCKGLLDSSRPGIPNPSSMVTIITGICLDNPRNFSYPLQLALGTATEAGVEIKNVRRFHREWKAIS
ncbi:nonsense-mediated mRNA decay factor SMG5-like [Erinaceus europaeus]|uniref:Nonsense-mediated mRNA decay factor n=1 Tax=Erinaceus europaeus TaxID=9365 RepID=A0ABM3XSH1_ERIEU|nr:nonsense-mediated mRNA decay factor SMG5-like [Erinaceus europaeus]